MAPRGDEEPAAEQLELAVLRSASGSSGKGEACHQGRLGVPDSLTDSLRQKLPGRPAHDHRNGDARHAWAERSLPSSKAAEPHGRAAALRGVHALQHAHGLPGQAAQCVTGCAARAQGDQRGTHHVPPLGAAPRLLPCSQRTAASRCSRPSLPAAPSSWCALTRCTRGPRGAKHRHRGPSNRLVCCCRPAPPPLAQACSGAAVWQGRGQPGLGHNRQLLLLRGLLGFLSVSSIYAAVSMLPLGEIRV